MCSLPTATSSMRCVSAMVAFAALLVLVESRSPYGASMNEFGYGPASGYHQDSSLYSGSSTEDGSLDGASPFGHQLQQAGSQFGRGLETAAIDEADDADGSGADDDESGSDSTENMPVSKQAGLGHGSYGAEEVDASELSALGGAAGGSAAAAEAAQQLQQQQQLDRQAQRWAEGDIDNDNDPDNSESADGEGQLNAAASGNVDQQEIGQDTNIANAKIELSPRDMSTAAGHHYHGHGVHGMLKMGAETGKKGAFKWYDKHPVGGKGRR